MPSPSYRRPVNDVAAKSDFGLNMLIKQYSAMFHFFFTIPFFLPFLSVFLGKI